MHILFSQSAISKLRPLLADENKQLKFFHDTEGCGCSVSGVAALVIRQCSNQESHELAGISNELPFIYDKQHAIYYDEQLHIDYNNEKDSFSLKSSGQIYTLNLRLIIQ